MNGGSSCDASELAAYFAKDASSWSLSTTTPHPTVPLFGRPAIKQYLHDTCIAAYAGARGQPFEFKINVEDVEYYLDNKVGGSFGAMDQDIHAVGGQDVVPGLVYFTSVAVRDKKGPYGFRVLHDSQQQDAPGHPDEN